ncbi:PQQ-dependent sugar dehydrogenase [Candidatus Leptofilum sp.]|uniref:PQQ-dependent sugar dehydrogenase n=1 Tax=Candidatus Leptofilum sp. TaxID=3241576 RepID=UPI003B5C285C
MVVLLLAGCSNAAEFAVPPTTSPTANLTLPDGFTAEIAASGLSGPTQMIWGPDGRLWVAQLFEGESDEAGQVVAVDLASNSQEVLLEGLNKPTGIAVLGGALWIATKDHLLRASLDEALKPQTPKIILTNMPNNGRSNGTLTVTPNGHLLYETSGRRSGNRASDGSGILWQLDPNQPDNPAVLATGLKNAYAHVFDGNGRLWITEIGDGSVTGTDFEGQPPEELNLVVTGGDYGWPQCFGKQEPALNREGSSEICTQTELPAALFPPQSTPTSIAVAPWDDSVLLVALWLTGEVMAVQIEVDGNGRFTGTSSTFLTGIQNPQHLLPTPDGRLLVSDYRTGTIYRIRN